MKTLVVANRKGGVGKTTIATLLWHFLADQDQRLLALDLAHAGNFRTALLRSGRAVGGGPTDRALFMREAPDLAGQVRQAPPKELGPARLRDFLYTVDVHFDVCVIDTHSMPDLWQCCALGCADVVLVPMQLHRECFDGLGNLLQHQRLVPRDAGKVVGASQVCILPNLVESNDFQRAMLERLVREHGALLIPQSGTEGPYALLRRRSLIAEAQATGQVPWTMKHTGAGAACNAIRRAIGSAAALVARQEVQP